MSASSSSLSAEGPVDEADVPKEVVREKLLKDRVSVPHYRDLSWRLDAPVWKVAVLCSVEDVLFLMGCLFSVKVASRTHPMSSEIVPHFLLKLETVATTSPHITETKTEGTVRNQGVTTQSL
jgi:hypothetical protein